MKSSPSSLLVVGAGTMGAAIAQVAAMAGWHVWLHDKADGAAGAALQRIAASMERAETKGYLSAEDRSRTLGNLHPSPTLDPAAESTAVIEAVKEDLEIKRGVFRALDAIAPASVFLWTNTSMLSVTAIAGGLQHPGRVAGTHFFNPVPRMKLVEIIAGKETSEDTLRAAEEAVRQWGKTPVRAPDSPGFLVNRILDAIKREALDLLDEGVEPERVDAAVRLGLNFPMGPFELMDLVGLDTTLDCLLAQARAMGRQQETGRGLKRLVEAGKLGRKTGEGFHSYPKR